MVIDEELELIMGLLKLDPELSNSLLKAKEHFFELCGKVQAADVNYQTRMNCFLNWFLFDWKLKDEQTIFKTIVSKFGAQQLQSYHYQFDKNLHSVFLFLKEHKKGCLVYDLFAKKKYLIEQDNALQTMTKKSCFETRVFTINEKNFFSNYFIIHPLESNRYIRKSIKSFKANSTLFKNFVFQLHKHYYKWHTYKHFTVQQIYCA